MKEHKKMQKNASTDQFILALTGYRRESFVLNRVVMPGKEGVEVVISVGEQS